MTKARRLSAVVVCMAAACMPVLIVPARAQQTERARRLGTRIRCMCGGCDDAAGKCYHVGGAFSGPCGTAKTMLKELEERVARGESDDLTLQSFVQEYGPAVYVEPPHQGFGRVAWWIPAVALTAGLALVVLVISRWRNRPAAVASGPSALDISPESLERARRQADRETEE